MPTPDKDLRAKTLRHLKPELQPLLFSVSMEVLADDKSEEVYRMVLSHDGGHTQGIYLHETERFFEGLVGLQPNDIIAELKRLRSDSPSQFSFVLDY